MRCVVVGGTGTVGAWAAQALRDRGVAVRVLTRSARKARELPAGIEGAVIDPMQPDTLAAPLAGATAMVLAAPRGAAGAPLAIAAVAAADAAGIERLVHVSAAGVDTWPWVPHLAALGAVERAVRAEGRRHTVLRPTDLYQNDLPYREPICERGVYPHPLGEIGVSRIDARDVADAAANAVTERGHEGMTYTLGGPDELTGSEVARVYRRNLRSPVRYAGDDLAAWAANAHAVLGEAPVAELRELYGLLCRHGLLVTDGELAAARRVVGHAPRTFEEFAAETAMAWRS
jgi:uncharacterized protein YbjT (DUF2867 family)